MGRNMSSLLVRATMYVSQANRVADLPRDDPEQRDGEGDSEDGDGEGHAEDAR